MSWPSFSATATSLVSRLTKTSAVASSLRNFFSIPCAQNAHTRPLTFISMVRGVAAHAVVASARLANSTNTNLFIGGSLSEIEHRHGLQLAVERGARFDPDAAP